MWSLCSAIKLKFVFIGILFPKIAFLKANLDTLIQAQIIFRHGSRTIDETFPTDPYKNESYWAPGYSQLTNLGKLQGYKLGLYLRERYDGFVKDTYDMKDVFILSSDFPRTLQTAYSLMAGFYLPNQILSSDNETDYLASNDIEIPLPWKSAVVHTIPLQYDNILQQSVNICPRYVQLNEDLLRNSEDMRTFSPNITLVSDYIYNQTGWKSSGANDLWLNLGTLFLEEFYNMTLPNWAQQLLEDGSVYNMYIFSYQMITYTDDMKRLRAGPLIERLVQNMVLDETLLKDEFERSRSGRKKIYFYSAHDGTIAGVLNTLGIYDKKRPPLTSALIFELHKRQMDNGKSTTSEQDSLYLEIYYRNETDREPYQLQIPGYGLQCPLADFIKLTKPYIPENLWQECLISNEPSSLYTGGVGLIVICVWILLFVLQVWFSSKCLSKVNNQKHRSQYSYLK